MCADRVALITGGTRGMGKHIALAFGKSGYAVGFTYNTDESRASEVAREVRQLGVGCVYRRVDVGNETDVVSMRDEVLASFGRVDVLVNNAGIFEDALVGKVSLDSWERVIKVNLTGTFLCISSIIGVMERQQYGRIINIGSVVGQTGTIGAANYAASKAGLIGLTKAVAREAAKKGITANVVSLGYMNDGMGKRLPEHIMSKVTGQIPAGRLGDAEKAAKMIVHLASEEAEYITGQVLGINGGLYM